MIISWGGGYFQGFDVDTAASRWRPFRNEGRTPQFVASHGEAGGTPRPGELVEGLRHHAGRLQGRRTRVAMRLTDGSYDPLGGRHIPRGDWPGVGTVEVDIWNHQSPAIVFHLVP